MKTTRLELMLHPTRMGILQTLIGGRRLTAGQMSQLLPDVPQATLYRHLGRLLEAGLIEVVEERPVRGTVERVFELQVGAATLTPEEVRDISPEEHSQLFAAFTAGLVASLQDYLGGDSVDPAADGLSYRQATVHLSSEERQELLAAWSRSLAEYAALGPAPNRRPVTLTTIVMPETRSASRAKED